MVKWILALLGAIVPMSVGAVEALAREFPAKDKFFGQPINLVGDVILPSVAVPAIVLCAVAYLLASLLVSKRLQRRARSTQLIAAGALALLAIGALWLCIVWVLWNIAAAHHGYWDGLFAPFVEPAPWTIVIGLLATICVGVVVSYRVRQVLYIDRYQPMGK